MSSHSQSLERGSIHAILVANSSRWYVDTHPLTWKKEHLEHLGYKLHPPSLSLDQNVPLSLDSKWDDFRAYAVSIQKGNGGRGGGGRRDEQMRYLFEELFAMGTGSPLQRETLIFQYGGHTVAKIRLPFVFCKQQSIPDRAWAYIDKYWASEQRHDFHGDTTTGYMRTMRVIRDIKDLPLDPFYVAILIALAQKSRGARSPSSSRTSYKVSLFSTEHTAGTSSTDEQSRSSRNLVTYLKQYTAIITDEYLQKFDDPYHFYDCALHIHQRSFHIDQPTTILRAIQEASRAQDSSSVPLPESKKRKALGDITGVANKVQRMEKVEAEGNKRRGSIAAYIKHLKVADKPSGTVS